jgi:hypothetical protein
MKLYLDCETYVFPQVCFFFYSAIGTLVDDKPEIVKCNEDEPIAKRPAKKSFGSSKGSDGLPHCNTTEWKRARVPCSKMSCSKSGFSPTCFVNATERFVSS